MGEQFVTGETIDEALQARRARWRRRGFRYSYDMLGEAATTAADAARYYADYEHAIHAIGKASAGRGIYDGPGISIKLSALHPRYARAQRDRVMAELLPRVKALALLAKRYDIGLNIDAEEADRLELSLDLLEALRLDPELAGWNGIGFVVQAYEKRCPFVLDFIIDLARRTGHRIMVRLVKGAYWDGEIKRAQVDGLDGFPVYTRKVHTDVSYLACARKLLAATDAVFPQFATHNAQTLATIYRHGRARFRGRPVRVPVPARHGRAALRRGRRQGQARPPLPHLCAGRHARDAARLSRPPPARERRQLLLRQPHRRSRRLDRRAGRRPGRRRRAPCRRSARRTTRSRCRATSTARRAAIRAGLDLSNEHALSLLSRRRCRPAPRSPGRPRRILADRTIAGDGARRCAIPPITATSSARSARPPPTMRAAPSRSPLPTRAQAGRRRRRPSAPPASSAPPTSWRRACRRCSA